MSLCLDLAEKNRQLQLYRTVAAEFALILAKEHEPHMSEERAEKQAAVILAWALDHERTS